MDKCGLPFLAALQLLHNNACNPIPSSLPFHSTLSPSLPFLFRLLAGWSSAKQFTASSSPREAAAAAKLLNTICVCLSSVHSKAVLNGLLGAVHAVEWDGLDRERRDFHRIRLDWIGLTGIDRLVNWLCCAADRRPAAAVLGCELD
jgi:hypothetical protein